jgi:hypothetical protein
MKNPFRVLFAVAALALLPTLASAQDYSHQPNLARIGITPALHAQFTGNGSIVAVMDGYAQRSHVDLVSDVVYLLAYSGNFGDGKHIHGTYVSGLITADGVGSWGVAPKVDVWNIPVFSAAGAFLPTDQGRNAFANLAYWDGRDGRRIVAVNQSYGQIASGDIFQAGELNVMDDYAANFVIVRAAMNEGALFKNEPYSYGAGARLRHLLIVGAVDASNVLTAWSNRPGNACIANTNPCADQDRTKNFFVVAPGTDILGTTPDDTWTAYSGTSAAAPLVTGIIALIDEAARVRGVTLSPSQMAEAVKTSATDLGEPGVDGLYGWGLVNAPAALAMVRAPGAVITAVVAPSLTMAPASNTGGASFVRKLSTRFALGASLATSEQIGALAYGETARTTAAGVTASAQLADGVTASGFASYAMTRGAGDVDPRLRQRATWEGATFGAAVAAGGLRLSFEHSDFVPARARLGYAVSF